MKVREKTNYLIIGQGAAGTAAANELRRLDDRAAVTVIAEETEGFYSRIDLPDILSGQRRPQDALLQSLERFHTNGIDCLVGTRVVRIVPGEHAVELATGQWLNYDKLLLATGSRPVVLRIPGALAEGSYTLWTMEQALRLAQAAAKAQAAVVIGAGLIGLKTALALRKVGLQVTVLERQSRIMPQQLDEPGAAILEEALKDRGIEVFTGAEVETMETNGGKICGITSSRGRIKCELAVFAAGVRPDTAAAQTAGIHIGAGIVADEYLRTSDADIYTAGDAAAVIDVFGKRVLSAGWPAAVEQGTIAARNMSGCLAERYTGYVAKNSVEVAGVPLVSVGNVQAAGVEALTQRIGNVYKKLVIKDNRLQGFLLMGNIREAGVLAGAVVRAEAAGRIAATGGSCSYVDLMAL